MTNHILAYEDPLCQLGTTPNGHLSPETGVTWGLYGTYISPLLLPLLKLLPSAPFHRSFPKSSFCLSTIMLIFISGSASYRVEDEVLCVILCMYVCIYIYVLLIYPFIHFKTFKNKKDVCLMCIYKF